MNRTGLILLCMVLLLLLANAATAAVWHSPFPWRSEQSWLNLYPNGAARIWQHWDSLFVDGTTGLPGSNSELKRFYPITDEDSLFTPTLTIISALGDTAMVRFFGKWTDDTNGSASNRIGVAVLSGEGVTIPAVWDSLHIRTDSAYVRVWTYGHPEW